MNLLSNIYAWSVITTICPALFYFLHFKYFGTLDIWALGSDKYDTFSKFMAKMGSSS